VRRTWSGSEEDDVVGEDEVAVVAMGVRMEEDDDEDAADADSEDGMEEVADAELELCCDAEEGVGEKEMLIAIWKYV
jgi:hypothetical protein